MPPFNEKQEPAKEQCHLSINVENSPHSCLLVLGLYEGWVNVAKGGVFGQVGEASNLSTADSQHLPPATSTDHSPEGLLRASPWQ